MSGCGGSCNGCLTVSCVHLFAVLVAFPPSLPLPLFCARSTGIAIMRHVLYSNNTVSTELDGGAAAAGGVSMPRVSGASATTTKPSGLAASSNSHSSQSVPVGVLIAIPVQPGLGQEHDQGEADPPAGAGAGTGAVTGNTTTAAAATTHAVDIEHGVAAAGAPCLQHEVPPSAPYQKE